MTMISNDVDSTLTVAPDRPDVYRRVHRGLRAALFELTTIAGRTAWRDRDDVAALQRAFFETFEFLRSHGEMEDTFQLPLLESKMPGITAHDAEQHRAIEEAIESLEAAFAGAIVASGDARVARGEIFLHRLCTFVADYLRHMTHEETVTMPLFHRYCTDAEIADAGRRLIAALGPVRASAAMRRIIPALDADDRAAYLRMVLAAVPHAAADDILSLAQSSLSEEDWRRTRATIETSDAIAVG